MRGGADGALRELAKGGGVVVWVGAGVKGGGAVVWVGAGVKKGIALTQEEAASLDISARTGKSGESMEKSKHHSDVISEGAYLLSTDGDFGEMAAWLVKQEQKEFGKT